MIDHFGIRVKDLSRSKSFYQAVLSPLGYQVKFDSEYGVSFVEDRSLDPAGDFWIGEGEPAPLHFAFNAQTRAQVDAFYQAGLQVGAKDNGAPGVREHYHPQLLRSLSHRS